MSSLGCPQSLIVVISTAISAMQVTHSACSIYVDHRQHASPISISCFISYTSFRLPLKCPQQLHFQSVWAMGSLSELDFSSRLLCAVSHTFRSVQGLRNRAYLTHFDLRSCRTDLLDSRPRQAKSSILQVGASSLDSLRVESSRRGLGLLHCCSPAQ
jgi:hypothetical protein